MNQVYDFWFVVLGHRLSSNVRNCKWDTSSVLVDEPKFQWVWSSITYLSCQDIRSLKFVILFGSSHQVLGISTIYFNRIMLVCLNSLTFGMQFVSSPGPCNSHSKIMFFWRIFEQFWETCIRLLNVRQHKVYYVLTLKMVPFILYTYLYIAKMPCNL